MSAIYTTRCNGCGAASPCTSDMSLQAARRNASSFGWTHPKQGADFCKKCSEARAERAKKENPNGYH